MANRSFEFKIGADTSDFIKNLNSAEKAVNSFDKQAQKIEKGLEIEFDDKRFTQSQKMVQQALELTEEKAQACREELKYLEEHGKMDTDGYKDVQDQLALTETRAVQLKKRLEELNTLKFTTLANNLSKAGQGLTSFANAMKPVAVASTAAVAGLAKVAKDAIAAGDEIATLAQKYGLSATEIQKWQYIAMQSDVEDSALYRGILKLNAAVADLAQGDMNAVSQSLLDLGLDANTSFDELINKLSSIEDATAKTYYANQIFGDRLAADMLPLLNQGADAIAEYTKEFEEVGYLSEEAVSALAQFDNVLNKLKTEFKQTALELGTALLPLLKTVVEYVEQKVLPKIRALVDRFDKMKESTKELALKIALLIPVVTALTAGAGKLLTGIGSIIKVLPQLGSLLSALEAHPIIAIIGLIAMLLTVLYAKNEQFRDSMNRLLGILSKAAVPIFEELAESLRDIFELLGPIIEVFGSRLADDIANLCEWLEPLVELVNALNKGLFSVQDAVLGFFGKGWAWGKGRDTDNAQSTSTPHQTYSAASSYPSVVSNAYDSSSSNSTYTTDNSTVVNNITIEANEYTTAEEVAKILSLKLQSRR